MNLMNFAEYAIELRGVSKEYGTLRPLRISHFVLRQAQTVALLGFDLAAAEVLVNLITAATLPDAGEVAVFGSSTRDITDFDAWFRLLDRIGVMSQRVALIDELTVEQNLALPLSLEVDGMAPELRSRVGKIADEVGIGATERMQSMRGADASMRMRVRLGKALALDPCVLLAEHPNAAVPPNEVARLGAALAAIAVRRGLSMLVLTADTAFAAAACKHVLTLRPASGELVPASRWTRWFARDGA
jgi:ABC-type transporter Mla maintaining outer membrane lipid asymmetry ATPase subunit MlaF